MTFLTAASIEDLTRQVAETAMRLGRMGAVLDAIEVRKVALFSGEVVTLTKSGPGGTEQQKQQAGDRTGMIEYERYECQLHHHWAALDEATHRPVRQQQSAGGTR